MCMSGEVEDERHFVLSCVVYKEMRNKMFEVVKEVMLKKKKEEIETVLETDEGRQRIFRALMGDSEEVVEGRIAPAGGACLLPKRDETSEQA